MGDFLDAAQRVLQHEGRPLAPKEITDIAITQGWLETKGETPHQTMKARLSDDILRYHDRSVFMRTGKGMFALRIWKADHGEYIADRYVKALLDENAVVFDTRLLKSFLPGPGLHNTALASGRELLAACKPMLRRSAEEDPSVIQLVSAFILQYHGEWLTYKRTKRLPESRLHGAYSVSFGGHLTPGDLTESGDPADAALALFDLFDPAEGYFFLNRELKEEVRLRYEPKFRYRGILYDDRREVSRQHLGIVYDVFLRDDRYEIGERGFLMDPKFEPLEQIEARISEFENWSELLIRDERNRRCRAVSASESDGCA
jgi:predicted NUDIX family phosphoesterase